MSSSIDTTKQGEGVAAGSPDTVRLLLRITEMQLETAELLNEALFELRELAQALRQFYSEAAIHHELESWEQRHKRRQELNGNRGSGGFELAERAGKLRAVR